jgi:hypothetical protein
MSNSYISYQKHTIHFSVSYTIFAILVSAFLIYFDIDNNFLTLLSVYAAVAVTVHIFAKEHQRPLAKEEMWRMTFYAFIYVVIYTVVVFWALLAWVGVTAREVYEAYNLNAMALIGLLTFAALFTLVVIRASFGSLNKSLTKKYVRNNT